MRKRIAVIVAQIDETTQKRFLTEFIKQAYVYDYDVCVFSMYQKYQETMLRNVGDSNIFKLVNYDLFDAIVILIDTILTPGLALPLQEEVKRKFNGPVLVVDQESPYFDSVMMDHYTPVKKIINHLIEVHNYTDIAFLGGKEGHPHSLQRLNAFLDCMKEHGISIKENRIFHGNYWYDSAEEVAQKLLDAKEGLPRALVCANDYMAIGAATYFTERGLRVPEDIAITGYDSIDDGKYSPSPLTSANIPADECGKYCMQWLHDKLNGSESAKFESMAPIFVGGSCGCKHEIEMVPRYLRSRWRTQQSSRSMFSDFNHILEDLLAQSNFKKFLGVVRDYAYQIRPFSQFDICMNDGFLNPVLFVGESALREGYTDTIYRVLSCGEDESEQGVISFETGFAKSLLIPELTQERDYPTTFIFNPIYFDDRCFGYTVLNYGERPVLYDEGYRIWMRNIMQGMEAFYRQMYMLDLLERVKGDQVRDTMTGLYNYDGFIKYATPMLGSQDDDRKINILTIDIKGMKRVNEIYGMSYGERVIRAVARSIQNNINDDEVCCRMCNDEYLVAVLDDANSTRAVQIEENLVKEVNAYNLFEDIDYQTQIHLAHLSDRPKDSGELELLVNRAISVKNHKKNLHNQSADSKEQELLEEIQREKIVTQVLNDNTLTYHYQPIVNAYDGGIYAYEALMRCEGEDISPVQIMQAATYLDRLNDVEKATLLNVTADVENNIEWFGNAKIFVNSLPGTKLSKEDDRIFSERLLNNKGRFVIELTEEAELDDSQLKALKEKYEKLGNQIAVDDYGVGYSNVNNLIRYVPQYVKIDRLLITDIHENPQKQHMVKSIIDYAHNNDIVALAEGVDSREELQECIRLGADLIQGYYTGKASRVPVAEIDVSIRSEIERFHNNLMWGL